MSQVTHKQTLSLTALCHGATRSAPWEICNKLGGFFYKNLHQVELVHVRRCKGLED